MCNDLCHQDSCPAWLLEKDPLPWQNQPSPVKVAPGRYLQVSLGFGLCKPCCLSALLLFREGQSSWHHWVLSFWIFGVECQGTDLLVSLSLVLVQVAPAFLLPCWLNASAGFLPQNTIERKQC